ncbi:MAG: response regulator transcription factor [Pseudomonadota bacterium]
MPKLTLIIADDHQIVRDGLRSLLTTNVPDIDVVGEAANGRDAVRLARRRQPDMALLDISMPGLNGVDAMTQIAAAAPDCKVICLSMHRSGEFVTRMLGAGALGYVHKDTAFDELSDAIRTVAAGDVYLGDGVAGALVADYQRLKSSSADLEQPELTGREREVLQLIAEGMKTRDIASELGISVKTVESHRGQLMRKLDIDGIAGLTRYAILHGIVNLDS